MMFITFIYLKVVKFKTEFIEIDSGKKSIISIFIILIINNTIYIGIFNFWNQNSIFITIFEQLLLCIPSLVFLTINKEGVKSVGLSRKNLDQLILLGCILSIIYIICNFTIDNVSVGYYTENINSKIIFSGIVLFGYCLIISFCEEFIYRGYVQTRLMALLGINIGWILASMIFVFMHIPFNMIVYKMKFMVALQNCIFKIPMGFILGYVYKKTNNLIPSIILHTTNNWVIFMFRQFTV